MKTRIGTIFGLAIMMAWVALLTHGAENVVEHPKPTFDADGNLERPEGYREWVYIGTPLTPNDMNPPEAPFPEFHNVYIHPADFDHWKRTGTFPEGTVIIKELVTVGSKKAVSGNGYFMGEFAGLEATIKDSKRFASEPGGWAYFSFGHSYPLADKAMAFATASCNSCHQATAADDFVFTPVLPRFAHSQGWPRWRENRDGTWARDLRCHHDCDVGSAGIFQGGDGRKCAGGQPGAY